MVKTNRRGLIQTKSKKAQNQILLYPQDYSLEPFSGVEIHMEMDMEWKWMEMGHNL